MTIWTHTCCGTDHSKGCARVDWRPFENMPICRETTKAMFEAIHGAKVALGYEAALALEEVQRRADLMWKIEQEDRARRVMSGRRHEPV